MNDGTNIPDLPEVRQFSIGKIASVLVVGAALGLGALYFYYWDGLETAPTETTGSYRAAIIKNDAFAKGEELRLGGDVDAAAAHFEQVLTEVDGTAEEGIVKLRIALSKQRGTDEEQLEAVRLYKEIAANTSYSLQVRAYAVHNMASLLSTRAFDPTLAYEVFKDPPYDQMATRSKSLLTRRLTEYASSLYPIAGAEFNLAYLYAREALNISDDSDPDEEKIASLVSQVRERLENGERDLSVIMRQHENYLSTVPYILLQKSKALGIMEVLGETSFANADEAYEKTLSAYAMYSTPGGDGYARFYYALHILDTQKESGHDKVIEILSPLYETDLYAGRPFERYLADARLNLTLSKRQIISLAAADADFKTHLKSLGWVENDF